MNTAGSLLQPHFEVHGAHGPYLLMVHGMLSGRSQWLDNLDGLKKFCRPVILELFGHGRSPSPADSEFYQAESYIKFFEQIRRSLGVKSWFVCGQSFGATLTFRYIHQHPERVLGHVFTNSNSAFGSGAVSPKHAERIQAQADRIAAGGRAALEKMPIHPRYAKRLPQQITSALLADAELLDPIGVAHNMRQVTGLSARDYLEEISVPNLLVVVVTKSLLSRVAESPKRVLAICLWSMLRRGTL